MRKKIIAPILISTLLAGLLLTTGCGAGNSGDGSSEGEVVLRISNWEEYIDLGDWDEEEELIDLEDGTEILGVNEMTADFEEWYEETYGIPVRVEYSTFGTNEELYNQMTIGDVYDLVCPSEYMIMKMLREDMLVPYSDEFHNLEDENNYYERGLSPYIRSVYDTLTIDGQKLSEYASGYMWGTYGIVYNPEVVKEEDAAHWDLMLSDKYAKRITIKDSVRECLFSGLAIANYDEITAPSFIESEDYSERLSEAMNRTDQASVDAVEEILSRIKDNVYSFETDSGKADMVTGKVVANAQWSGDAVYTMDQADEDGLTLYYSAPEEGTNIWFDGWVMMKNGLAQDARKQHAAEAFVNFVSMPENAIRNMYYIGYTSVISGGESDLIFQYMDWCYGADEDEEEVCDYAVGYFFDMENPDADEEYCITAPIEQTKRQLYAQYPPKEVVDRSVVMRCFDNEGNERINRMWTNVRCFDLKSLFR